MGIDFTGGIVLEIRTERPADLSVLRKVLSHEKFGEVTLQNFGSSHDVIIRMSASDNANNTLEEVNYAAREMVKIVRRLQQDKLKL